MIRRHFLFDFLGLTALPGANFHRACSIVSIPPEFPQPKFHFGQEVLSEWEDEFGEIHPERGFVVGMIYESADYPRREWSYLISWTHRSTSIWMTGTDDGTFLYEHQLKAV